VRPLPCSAPPLSCSGRCGVRGSGRRGRIGGEQAPLLGEGSASATASPSPAVEEGPSAAALGLGGPARQGRSQGPQFLGRTAWPRRAATTWRADAALGGPPRQGLIRDDDVDVAAREPLLEPWLRFLSTAILGDRRRWQPALRSSWPPSVAASPAQRRLLQPRRRTI